MRIASTTGRGCRRHDEPAEQGCGRVVGMAFDPRSDAQLRRRVERSAKQRIRRHDTGHGRRGGRPETTAHRDLIAHLDAPANAFGQFTASGAHRGLEPPDEPVVAILG
jgi:hypothetical protein